MNNDTLSPRETLLLYEQLEADIEAVVDRIREGYDHGLYPHFICALLRWIDEEIGGTGTDEIVECIEDWYDTGRWGYKMTKIWVGSRLAYAVPEGTTFLVRRIVRDGVSERASYELRTVYGYSVVFGSDESFDVVNDPDEYGYEIPRTKAGTAG